MPQRAPDVTPEILKGDLSEELLQAYLKGAGLAVDTETMGLETRRDRLCLVQLCNRDMRAAIVQVPRQSLDPGRPLAERAPRLKQLMEDPAVVKVFHFARFDVAALSYWLGIAVSPLFCTRTASKLARTYTDRHGLKDNLLELLDVELDKAAREVMSANHLVDAYIRPLAWRGSEQMGVSAQKTTINVAIAAWDWGAYFDPAARERGLKLTFAKYRRPDPMTAPVHSKAAGLYMICTIEKHRAEREGYADAMMLDWRGQIAEATGANIFFVKDGVLHTPTPDCFLDGITRRTAIGLAKQRGWAVIERAIQPEDMADFSECFITGTAAEVMPVSEIGPYRFEVGEITKTLMDDYSALVRPAKAIAAAG